MGTHIGYVSKITGVLFNIESICKDKIKDI